jgi:hypothetical protein
MTSVGEVNIEEGISLTRMEYSVLKEKMEEDECGWSDAPFRCRELRGYYQHPTSEDVLGRSAGRIPSSPVWGGGLMSPGAG